MITKILVSAAIAVVAAVGVAAPAVADPYACRPALAPAPFCSLSQAPAPKAGPAAPNQITQGIQKGLSDLQATQGQQ
ncbi:MAG TPA: hypothetical protein VEF72_33290 [Mycobacterium sp.]|nr:hypothetical protein [Mycobacterium sp.]